MCLFWFVWTVLCLCNDVNDAEKNAFRVLRNKHMCDVIWMEKDYNQMELFRILNPIWLNFNFKDLVRFWWLSIDPGGTVCARSLEISYIISLVVVYVSYSPSLVVIYHLLLIASHLLSNNCHRDLNRFKQF